MEKLQSLLELLDGKKFYLALLAGFILWLGWVLGWWTLEQVQELLALDGLFLGLAWRSAHKKAEL